MKKSTVINIVLGVAVVLVFGISLAIGNLNQVSEERFGGTDGQATEQIEAANPDYVPWFDSLFQVESGELESGLFAVQAALGGIVLGFALGALWGRRSTSKVRPTDDPSGDDNLAASQPSPGAAPPED